MVLTVHSLRLGYKNMNVRRIKKTCLLFGEGGKEETFFRFLEDSHCFNNRFPNWRIEMSHASGEACSVILQKCINYTSRRDFDLVLCFIDTDNLYEHFPKKHEQEKTELEKMAEEYGINIIWQELNHEDEICRATNGKICTKNGMKGRLARHSTRVLNSDYTKRILSHFRKIDLKSSNIC